MEVRFRTTHAGSFLGRPMTVWSMHIDPMNVPAADPEPWHALQEICDIGYSPHDIITTFFRVVKLSPELPEFLKLEFIRVREPTT